MSKLAINGGVPVRGGKSWPRWPVRSDDERNAVIDAVENSDWGGFPEPQPRAAELGRSFAAYQDARYGICCTNGSISLEIALRAAGVKAGDEVIVPCTTWIATAACAVYINAVPVFVDVSPDNYCIDPDLVEAAVTDRTRAIVPVHLGSSIADLDRLTQIAEKYDLILLEDCAHAHGSQWRDKGVGSWGHFGSFSFQTSKILTSGEGGLITTNDDLYAEKVHSLVNCGRKEEGYDSFDGWLLGYNARMTEMQCGVMLAQLARADELLQIKNRNATRLTEGLAAIGGLTPVPVDPRETRRGVYQFILNYDAAQFEGVHRDGFLEALTAEGIEMDGIFYPPLPHNPLMNATTDEFPMLRERYGDGIRAADTLAQFSFPVGEKFALDEGCWLHYPYLLGEAGDTDDILEAVAKVKEHIGELA